MPIFEFNGIKISAVSAAVLQDIVRISSFNDKFGKEYVDKFQETTGVKEFTYGNAIYGSSKAALKSWMKFVSKKFGIKNIRANVVCPGMIETPLIHKGTITEEQLKQDANKDPLGRYGKHEEIAYGAIYLLSEAAAWTTGTSLIIDGGISN